MHIKNRLSKTSIIVFILACCLLFSIFSPVNETNSGEKELELGRLESYVPLRMHFGRGFSRSGLEGTLSDGKIRIVVYSHVPWLSSSPSREEFVIEPTEAEWEEFFRVCEKANIWGLEATGRSLSRSVYSAISSNVRWVLWLEYPNRILKIAGEELAVDPSADVMGVVGEHSKRVISRNVRITNEHENIQMIFNAIKRLLGESFSGYNFNLTS